ncbi:MAG: hypothetical protein E7Z84_05390 [Methanosphaera stadtmanae]|nr:hypothetical protein [Methanosphaera stadtmanae]
MITIEEIDLNEDFDHLWLKYVTDVDVEHYGEKSLIGKNTKQINKKMFMKRNVELDEFDAKYYYLYAESNVFGIPNFDLAFKEKEGSVIDIEENGIKIIISNAERIDITPDAIDPKDPHADDNVYKLCKIWHFAYQIKDELEKQESEENKNEETEVDENLIVKAPEVVKLQEKALKTVFEIVGDHVYKSSLFIDDNEDYMTICYDKTGQANDTLFAVLRCYFNNPDKLQIGLYDKQKYDFVNNYRIDDIKSINDIEDILEYQDKIKHTVETYLIYDTKDKIMTQMVSID